MMKNQSTMTSPEPIDQRTKWAYERTLLANERTFIAWLRTGLAVTAASAIVVRLLSDVEPRWPVNIIAIVLALAGVIIVGLSAWGYQRMHNQLETVAPGFIPQWVVWILVAALEFSALAILVLLIIG